MPCPRARRPHHGDARIPSPPKPSCNSTCVTREANHGRMSLGPWEGTAGHRHGGGRGLGVGGRELLCSGYRVSGLRDGKFWRPITQGEYT